MEGFSHEHWFYRPGWSHGWCLCCGLSFVDYTVGPVDLWTSTRMTALEHYAQAQGEWRDLAAAQAPLTPA